MSCCMGHDSSTVIMSIGARSKDNTMIVNSIRNTLKAKNYNFSYKFFINENTRMRLFENFVASNFLSKNQ